MDELLTEDRKTKFFDLLKTVLEDDILTNLDAMMITEIIKNACRRKETELYENAVKEMIESDDEEK